MGAIENAITQSTLTADHAHPYNLFCTCQISDTGHIAPTRFTRNKLQTSAVYITKAVYLQYYSFVSTSILLPEVCKVCVYRYSILFSTLNSGGALSQIPAGAPFSHTHHDAHRMHINQSIQCLAAQGYGNNSVPKYMLSTSYMKAVLETQNIRS